jgi:hypothetical protein
MSNGFKSAAESVVRGTLATVLVVEMKSSGERMVADCQFAQQP